MEVALVRVVTCSISVGVAALVVGFAVKSGGTPAGPVEAGLQGERAGISVLGAMYPETSDLRSRVGSRLPARPGVRVASLESNLDSGIAAEEVETRAEAPISTRRHASFEERFGSSADERFASFEERFGASFEERPRQEDASVVFGDPVWPMPFADALQPPLRTFASPAQVHTNGAVPSVAAKRETVAVGQPATVTAPLLLPGSKKPDRTAEAPDNSILPSGSEGHTAIYDIAAHVVYLPNGDRLEAHSGLGGNLDNPHSVGVKGRGVTPPNVYDLVLRKEPFHGVQAIRLIPVGEGKMFGRDGMLAHSYMLGPNGQSNGCVSFSNYQAFLNAYLKGDVDRLVVVEHLASAPAPRASAGWLPEVLRNLFNPS